MQGIEERASFILQSSSSSSSNIDNDVTQLMTLDAKPSRSTHATPLYFSLKRNRTIQTKIPKQKKDTMSSNKNIINDNNDQRRRRTAASSRNAGRTAASSQNERRSPPPRSRAAAPHTSRVLNTSTNKSTAPLNNNNNNNARRSKHAAAAADDDADVAVDLTRRFPRATEMRALSRPQPPSQPHLPTRRALAASTDNHPLFLSIYTQRVDDAQKIRALPSELFTETKNWTDTDGAREKLRRVKNSLDEMYDANTIILRAINTAAYALHDASGEILQILPEYNENAQYLGADFERLDMEVFEKQLYLASILAKHCYDGGPQVWTTYKQLQLKILRDRLHTMCRDFFKRCGPFVERQLHTGDDDDDVDDDDDDDTEIAITASMSGEEVLAQRLAQAEANGDIISIIDDNDDAGKDSPDKTTKEDGNIVVIDDDEEENVDDEVSNAEFELRSLFSRLMERGRNSLR